MPTKMINRETKSTRIRLKNRNILSNSELSRVKGVEGGQSHSWYKTGPTRELPEGTSLSWKHGIKIIQLREILFVRLSSNL